MATDSTNFIRARVESDRAAGKYGGRVATRFPPEPNGYLHIGHAKSICLNFGLATDFGGTCNLRFDDTNPTTEDPEYVDAILADVRWLGFEPSSVFYASDYFPQLYVWAEQLVTEGKAYVDDQTLDEIRATRGTVTEPGTPSPWRDRPVAENLDLLRRMRAGEFADGVKVLRAKIDMAHTNMKLRDPILYRIRHEHHYRTGDAWCIYPMYDWAHGQSDAIEGITHSICTLEFDVNRELYDWFTDALHLAEPPKQTEFARLNLGYTVMSKRFLKRLVTDGTVDGWDDPRLPTIAGMRRRGVTAEALRLFADKIGVAKSNSLVDIALFDWCLREDLNRRSARRMAVVDPIAVELTNWPADRVESFEASDFPPDVGLPGQRSIPFGRTLWIERADFAEVPPKGFHRLIPGGEVRLRYGYVIRCDQVLHDADGRVTKLLCTVDTSTRGHAPVGRKVKGVIHWVSAAHAVSATLNVIDRLFTVPEPDPSDLMASYNPAAMVTRSVWVEPSVSADAPGVRYQFERTGYVYRAPEDAHRGLIFHQIVGLKDAFEDAADGAEPVVVVAAPEVVDPNAGADAQARIRAEARARRIAEVPEIGAFLAAHFGGDASDDAAWSVASDATQRAWFVAARPFGSANGVASWLSNVLVGQVEDLGALKFDGAALGKLVGLVEAGTLSAALGKKVLAEMIARGGDPATVATANGWVQVSDASALEADVDAVLARNAAEAERYRAGETKLLGFLVGQAMAATKGRGNPGMVRELLLKKLG